MTWKEEKMKYRVRFKVSYSDAFFDFDDATDACNFMSMAAERLTTEGDKTEISLIVIREEA